MLSMQPDGRKFEIMQEAARILSVAGNYAIHELCLVNVTPELQETIHDELCHALRVNATPLTQEQWEYLLTQVGFKIKQVETATMALLEPIRILKAEGITRGLHFLYRVMRNPDARAKTGAMRKIFRKYREHLAAVMIVAEKQAF